MTDPDRHNPDIPDDRAADAFRAAMSGLNTPGELDPDAARRGAAARRNARLAIGGLVLVVIAAAGAVGLPVLLGSGPDGPNPPTIANAPDPLPGDPAPSGWRTEQYRGITFQVPEDWGYAFEPGPAWCAGSDGKTPRPEHRKPYVALGEPQVLPAIACTELPDALITEHAAATQPTDKKADGRSELGNGFWEVTRTVDAVRLRAVSRDVELAQRIVDSGEPAGDDARCDPDHPLAGDPEVRPTPAGDVTGYGAVDRIALCQYEVGPGQGLRAAAELTGPEAQHLIDGVAAAPSNESASCRTEVPEQPAGDALDLAVVLRVQTAEGVHELILRQRGCPEGGKTVVGGFDDGTTVRAATAETCRAVLVQPLLIEAGSGSVVERCRKG